MMEHFYISFLQLIVCIATKAVYAKYNNSMETVRLKRSVTDDLPPIFRAVIKDMKHPRINLEWVKTEQLLANNNLPVWGARCGGAHEFKTEAGEILDSFVMYQDLKQTSAIVYVRGKNMIYGNVDSTYYIHDLPITNKQKKLLLTVPGPYITKNPDAYLHGEHKRPQNDIFKYLCNTKIIDKCASPILSKIYPEKSTDDENPTRMKLTKKYYLETLVFITYDIVRPIQKEYPDDYLFHILLKYVVHFNSVDMILNKLPTKLKVFMNLAGIIFEENKDVFSSVIKSPILKYRYQKKTLYLDDFDNIFEHYYAQNPEFVFQKNSFDFVLLTTGRKLKEGNEEVVGLSFHDDNLYELRQMPVNSHMSLVPLMVTTITNCFYDYTVISHEIGHMIGNPEHDPLYSGQINDQEQCYGLMQERSATCYNCLKWSPESVHNIKKFMHENRDRCWFLNYPRSLYPRNVPRVYVLPHRQCRCFGYVTYGQELNVHTLYIPEDACAKRLLCLKSEHGNIYNEQTVVPFDGTPCAQHNKKVCWQQKCVDV